MISPSSFSFGIIQGLTEFLPISSSGHLLLFRSLFVSYRQPLVTDIILHLGSLFAILFFFKDTIKKNFRSLIKPLIISVLPAALIGFFMYQQVDTLFSTPVYLGLAFLITTFYLVIFPYLKWGNTSIKKVTSRQAVITGLFQALAIVPGISRSASTIFSSKLSGLDRETSFEFAFLMALPAISGSLLLSIKEVNLSTLSFNWSEVSAAFIASFFTSLLALTLLKIIIQSKKLQTFAWYTAILTGVSLALFV